jgi:hypothetical protein
MIGIEYNFIVGVIFRMLLISVMCAILYCMPWFGKIYFGKRKEKYNGK